MPEVKRPYNATRRRELARARQLDVIHAARELFERNGFRATTLAAIASYAGVSIEGIYKSFGSKAALAKSVFDLVIAGDDDPVPIAARPEADAVRAEPDAHTKVELFAAGLARRQARSSSVQLLIRDGRHVDASLEPVWDKLSEESLAGATTLARHLSRTGNVQPGLDENTVRDVLWNYFAIDHYERLVLHRNWSHARYTQWLSEAIADAVLVRHLD